MLSELPNIEMDNRVESVGSRLKLIPEMLDYSKEMIIYHSYVHHIYADKLIESIIKILDQLPLKLNSDNLTLDEIDRYIDIAKTVVFNYQNWLGQKYKNLSALKFPVDLKLIDNAFPYFISEKYISNNVYELAEKKKIPSQNLLFSLAFPLYLTKNDEPVWLERQDTMEVIHWTINSIIYKPENQVTNSEVLSKFYESISFYERLINEKNLFPKNSMKRIKLNFAPEYVQTKNSIYLMGYHQKDINSEIIYYIKQDDRSSSTFPLTVQEIYLTNAINTIPGRAIQIAHAQKYSSDLSYIFPDPINKSGWNIYALEMIIDEGLSEIDIAYNILLFKEKIKLVCWALVEEKYYSGVLDRKEAIEFLKKESFLSTNEAEELIMQSDLHYFSGTQSFIGMMEMNTIKERYTDKFGDIYSASNFHRDILQHGIIPLNELKKILFPQ